MIVKLLIGIMMLQTASLVVLVLALDVVDRARLALENKIQGGRLK